MLISHLIAQHLLVLHLRLVLNNCPSENEKKGEATRWLARRRCGGGLTSRLCRECEHLCEDRRRRSASPVGSGRAETNLLQMFSDPRWVAAAIHDRTYKRCLF